MHHRSRILGHSLDLVDGRDSFKHLRIRKRSTNGSPAYSLNSAGRNVNIFGNQVFHAQEKSPHDQTQLQKKQAAPQDQVPKLDRSNRNFHGKITRAEV